VSMKNRRGGGSAAAAAAGVVSRQTMRASIHSKLGKLTRGRPEYKELERDLARTSSYLALWYKRAKAAMHVVWRGVDSVVDHLIINSRRLWNKQSYQTFQWHSARGASAESKDVPVLQQFSEDIFHDIVHSHELREQAEFAATKFGKAIWWCGVFLSFVGSVRLYFALSHVAKGFFYTYIETQEQLDAETTVDIFMSATGMDPQAWAFSLNFLMIFFLGAFQIRALLGSMMIAARLGFLSTNTELYALVLAYISGFYFIASVVLLRTQLPIEYRKGVTLALGQFSFDYFEWLFDRIYISSSFLSLLYLWGDSLRKKKISRRFFLHDDR